MSSLNLHIFDFWCRLGFYETYYVASSPNEVISVQGQVYMDYAANKQRVDVTSNDVFATRFTV